MELVTHKQRKRFTQDSKSFLRLILQIKVSASKIPTIPKGNDEKLNHAVKQWGSGLNPEYLKSLDKSKYSVTVENDNTNYDLH